MIGLHAVGRVLRHSPERVIELYVQADLGARRRARLPELDDPRWPVTVCDAETLTRLAGTAKHQGIAARLTAAVMLDEARARERVRALGDCLLLVLDGVQDPRNFGACLRTADAAGVDLVVVGRSRNVGITPVVSKVAAGATETQPVAAVGNLARFLGWLGDGGVFIAGLAGEASASLYSADLRGPLALVLGGEAQGLRRLTRERCSALFSLPMMGGVESLNVSVATGVSLYEARRQRGWLAPPGGLG